MGKRKRVNALIFCLQFIIIISFLCFYNWQVQYKRDKLLHEATMIEYTVQPGDTLYDIAKEYNPHMDYRKVVDYIYQLNDTTAKIHPGQTLNIPVWRDQ